MAYTLFYPLFIFVGRARTGLCIFCLYDGFTVIIREIYDARNQGGIAGRTGKETEWGYPYPAEALKGNSSINEAAHPSVTRTAKFLVEICPLHR
jgi:hypothetical protein